MPPKKNLNGIGEEKKTIRQRCRHRERSWDGSTSLKRVKDNAIESRAGRQNPTLGGLFFLLLLLLELVP